MSPTRTTSRPLRLTSDSDDENKSDSDYFSLISDPVLTRLLMTQTDSSSKWSELETFKVQQGWAIDYMRRLHFLCSHAGLRACRDVVKRDRERLKLSDSRVTLLMEINKADLACDACGVVKSMRKHVRNKRPRRSTKRGKKWKKPRRGQVTFDVAGKNRPRSRTGDHYMFCTVLDDHCWSEVGFGKTKDKAVPYLIENLRVWRDMCERKPTVLKSDMGELTSKQMRRWATKHGMQQKFTATNSSSGSAENKIGTVQDYSLASMIHAGAPKSMWVEAARYANNVTQFVPSASPKMEGLSPYESLHKEMPPMHQLHTWGCLAFVNIHGHVVRYGEKGRPAAFVGLALNNNDGYRFYDGETKTIFHAKATPADFRENTSYFKWKKYKSAKEGLILDLQKARSSYAKDVHTANRFSDLEDLPGSISEEEEDVEPDEELVREPRARVPSLAAIESLGAAYLTQHEKTEEAMVSVTTSIVRKLHRKAHKMKHQENKGFSNMKPRAFRSNLEKYASALEARGTVKRLPSGSVPSTAWEALSSVDKHLWIEAMLAEIKSHQINKTMEGIRRNKVPPGRKLIKARWVFDLKRNEEGMVVR